MGHDSSINDKMISKKFVYQPFLIMQRFTFQYQNCQKNPPFNNFKFLPHLSQRATKPLLCETALNKHQFRLLSSTLQAPQRLDKDMDPATTFLFLRMLVTKILTSYRRMLILMIFHSTYPQHLHKHQQGCLVSQ